MKNFIIICKIGKNEKFIKYLQPLPVKMGLK